jgi:hypothetical protein
MTHASPAAAALEGLRVIRREPKAVLSWVVIWIVALVIIGATVILTHAPEGAAAAHGRGFIAVARRFGPLWPILVSTFLGLWVMTTASVFRAVLRADEHGWHLFKLGPDEVRIAIVTGAGSLIALLFGSVPVIMFLAAKPILALAPALEQWVVYSGALATVAVDIWIAVRLSFTPVHTFATRRLSLFDYWRITGGHFWFISAAYALVAFEMVLIFIAFTVLAGILAQILKGFPLSLEITTDLLAAVSFVLGWTIFCACQAFAYRAFASRSSPGPSAQPPPSAL